MAFQNRKQILLILLLSTCLFLTFKFFVWSDRPILLTGDIVFQESKSSQSEAIRIATGSRYSHVGMIVIKGQQVWVLEAVGRVKYTPLKEWIHQSDDGHYVVKRYQVKGDSLDDVKRARLVTEGEKFLNLPYDPYFLWSDKSQYCSELIHKIYERALGVKLSPLTRMRSFDLTHPAVKEKMQERFGDDPPLNEQVVPPSAIFDSKLLVTVYSE